MILSRNTDKQWCGCWKGMNANSMTMATISINVIYNKVWKDEKLQHVSKNKKRPFTLAICRNLIFAKLKSVVFHESHMTLLCASQNPNLTFRLSSEMHATTLFCFKWYILLLEWHPDSSFWSRRKFIHQITRKCCYFMLQNRCYPSDDVTPSALMVVTYVLLY